MHMINAIRKNMNKIVYRSPFTMSYHMPVNWKPLSTLVPLTPLLLMEVSCQQCVLARHSMSQLVSPLMECDYIHKPLVVCAGSLSGVSVQIDTRSV